MFSDVRVHLFEKDKLRAMASVKVADAFFLTGLRVLDGSKGLFVAMPSRKDDKGEYHDIYFAANRAIADELRRVVMAKYDELKGAAPGTSASLPSQAAAPGAQQSKPLTQDDITF